MEVNVIGEYHLKYLTELFGSQANSDKMTLSFHRVSAFCISTGKYAYYKFCIRHTEFDEGEREFLKHHFRSSMCLIDTGTNTGMRWLALIWHRMKQLSNISPSVSNPEAAIKLRTHRLAVQPTEQQATTTLYTFQCAGSDNFSCHEKKQIVQQRALKH